MKSTAVMRNPPITEQGVPVEGTSVLAHMLTYAHSGPHTPVGMSHVDT